MPTKKRLSQDTLTIYALLGLSGGPAPTNHGSREASWYTNSILVTA